MSDNSENNNSLTALVAGIVVGAAATYLFATKDGRKLKDKLATEGSKFFDKVKEGLEDVGDDVKEKSVETAKKAAEQARELGEKGKDALEDIPTHIQQVQKKGRRFFFKKHSSES